MAGLSQGLGETLSLVVALAAGGGAMFLVATMMKTMSRLKSDGTVRIERAVGKSGTVYLSVPGQKAGVGKVTLTLQNRSVEYQALTSHETLPTGAKIVFERDGMAHRVSRGGDCGFRYQGATQIGVQHGAGEIVDGLETGSAGSLQTR